MINKLNIKELLEDSKVYNNMEYDIFSDFTIDGTRRS